MRTLYTLVLYLLTPVALLRLTWKGLKNRAYWQRWPERFGYFTAPTLQRPLWIHAVSVGEFQAATPFIKKLMKLHPDRSLVITTTTPTGSSRVTSVFNGQVFHVYMPYDLPGAVGRFLDSVQPELALIMETELWPNLFFQCAQRRIPVCIANARLSLHSQQGYQRFKRLTKLTLQQVASIAARGVLDQERFLQLGAPANRVHVAGNIKFDLEIPDDQVAAGHALRADAAGRFIWIAASTHEGEELQVLEAHRIIKQSLPKALLLLVPRHPERCPHVHTLCQRQGFKTIRRSHGAAIDGSVDIYLGDTLGEMMLLYSASDVAFVAGSLVPIGGHNMLEAAAVGIPVISGPYLANFTEISQALITAGGMRKVNSPEKLAGAILQLATDSIARARMGKAGRQLVADNRGALNKLYTHIQPYL